MILNRYAICSERDNKPVTRIVCDTKGQAETELQRIRDQDGDSPEDDYWIAELGPESEGWRYLVFG